MSKDMTTVPVFDKRFRESATPVFISMLAGYDDRQLEDATSYWHRAELMSDLAERAIGRAAEAFSQDDYDSTRYAAGLYDELMASGAQQELTARTAHNELMARRMLRGAGVVALYNNTNFESTNTDTATQK